MTKYLLEVVQQPVQAHMCGFGDKRRSIDPPPVVKLSLFDDEGRIMENLVDLSFFSIHVDLWSENCSENCSLVVNPSAIPSTTALSRIKVISLNAPHYMHNLLGSLISSAYNLVNTKGEAGVYFIFPDLSVRTEGRFTLRFSFINLSQNNFNGSSMIMTRTFSKPFTVYSAKNFPGGYESTELTKHFIKQGIKIPTRRALLKSYIPKDVG